MPLYAQPKPKPPDYRDYLPPGYVTGSPGTPGWSRFMPSPARGTPVNAPALGRNMNLGQVPPGYNPSLGGTPGYSQPMNSGLITPEDPNKWKPVYKKDERGAWIRDEVTGVYEVDHWETASGMRSEPPIKRRGWQAYMQQFANPLAEGTMVGDPNDVYEMVGRGSLRGQLAMPGFAEENPQGTYSMFVDALPAAPAVKDWLTKEYGRLRSLYEGRQAINPSQTWLDFLGNLDLMKEYQGATPFARGENTRRYAPLTRFTGW